MRVHEAYELTCHGCQASIEIRCDGPHVCPKCGAGLSLQWRDEVEEPMSAKEQAA